MKKTLIVMLVFWGMLMINPGHGQSPKSKQDINEFGGRTVKVGNQDEVSIWIYYDDNDAIVKEETVYGNEYPIDKGLRKRIVYYASDKKIKEERVFTNVISQNTLITRTIDHFDRFTGLLTKTENHFVESIAGYNVVYHKNGRRSRIEWHYPKNVDGIAKSVMFFDDHERGTRVEYYYTEKTLREKGYYLKIQHNEYGPNRYFRKVKQEWFYTERFSADNNGIVRKVETFHNVPGRPQSVESYYFDRNDEPVARAESADADVR
jgi:hypothetical protein